MKITNKEIEIMSNATEILQVLIKKEFTAKTSYWLAVSLSELEKKSEIYAAEKKKIIEKHAVRDDKGEILQADNKISITDINKFNSEMKELLDIEMDLSMEKIPFDLEKEPACTIEEMAILLPLIEVI